MVSGHFAPWSFRPQSFHPNQKSLRSILKVTSPHTEVTLSYIFISFRSVHSERDNLFVSTWSQMQMITKLDVSESSQFVSELTQNTLANHLSTLAKWTNVGCFANVQFANILRRYLAWQWIKKTRIIIRFVYTLAKL